MQIIPKKRYSKHKAAGYYYISGSRDYIVERGTVISVPSPFLGRRGEMKAFFSTRKNIKGIIQETLSESGLNSCIVYRFKSRTELNSYLAKKELIDKLCK